MHHKHAIREALMVIAETSKEQPGDGGTSLENVVPFHSPARKQARDETRRKLRGR